MSRAAGEVRVAPGKQLLIDAATRLAAQRGSSRSLVLREVARAAGLNHNTFYRHFDSLDAMMESIVADFANALRSGLRRAREAVPPGEPVSSAVVSWLFDFAREHRDLFTVAMRERYGPPGAARDAVHGMLEQLRTDMLRDLTSLQRVPKLERARLLRLLQVVIDQTFQACLEYLEAPRRRRELLLAAQELFETLMAGAVAMGR